MEEGIMDIRNRNIARVNINLMCAPKKVAFRRRGEYPSLVIVQYQCTDSVNVLCIRHGRYCQLAIELNTERCQCNARWVLLWVRRHTYAVRMENWAIVKFNAQRIRAASTKIQKKILISLYVAIRVWYEQFEISRKRPNIPYPNATQRSFMIEF